MHLRIAAVTALLIALPVAAESPKPAAKTSPGDPAALSGAFWGDWNKTKASEEFAALKASVGFADKAKAAADATKGKQAIVDLAVAEPKAAAKLMSGASSAAAANAEALATVINMTTPPATREAALAHVEPEEAAKVESWNATLSGGIQGLPGVYLGDSPPGFFVARAAAPAGYTPVAGASAGCSTR